MLGKHRKIRLVDGGYVDNSGVETALDLLQSIAPMEKKIADLAVRKAMIPHRGIGYRPVQINLIVLSGGDYSVRSSFAMGETLEPIRTLLSTRTSRAYVAIDRAARQLPHKELETFGRDGTRLKVKVSALRLANLRNHTYQMPLGWALSKRTREIIEIQSGTFSGCDPDEQFLQSSKRLSEADCIHLLTYHELSKSLGAKLDDIADVKRVQADGKTPSAAGTGLNADALLSCYRSRSGKSISPVQSSAIQELLNAWAAQPAPGPDRLLAFALGSIAYESGDFAIRIENISYPSAQRISALWPRIFPTPESAMDYVNNPEALANKVYGQRLGNTAPGDGWRYRGRGLVQLTGRAAYQKYGQLVGIDLEGSPDLMLRPDISARVALAYLFPSGRMEEFQRLLDGATAELAKAATFAQWQHRRVRRRRKEHQQISGMHC